MFGLVRLPIPDEAARQTSALGLMGIVLLILLSGLVFVKAAFALVVCALAGREAWRLTHGGNGARFGVLVGWGAGLIWAAVGFAGYATLGAIGFVSTFCLVFLGVIAVATRRGKPREFGSAAGVGAGLLCAAALNCLPWLMTAAGSERVALVIWTTWAGDGGASLIRLSHRPHRRVWEWASPGKTWAGVAVGAVFSAVFAMIFVWLFDLSTTCVDLVAILVLVPVLGPAGDLCESILKRLAGAKDSGGLFLLPGHGGVLDRTDSLVLTVPCILLTWRLLS